MWPFPYKAFEDIKPEAFLSIDTTETGMLVEDVALAAKRGGNGMTPIYNLSTGNECATESIIVDYFYKIKNKEVKERF